MKEIPSKVVPNWVSVLFESFVCWLEEYMRAMMVKNGENLQGPESPLLSSPIGAGILRSMERGFEGFRRYTVPMPRSEWVAWRCFALARIVPSLSCARS